MLSCNPPFICEHQNKILLMIITAHPKVTCEDKLKEPQTFKSGATMILTAHVSGVPNPTVSWTHGDVTLTTTNGVTVETKEKSSTLTVKGMEGASSGTYTVKAENVVGADSLDFTVNVKGMCAA